MCSPKKTNCPLTSCFTVGLVCFAIKNKICQLSYSLFQTCQTGGQWYSETSPFSIPWLRKIGAKLLLRFKTIEWALKGAWVGQLYRYSVTVYVK